MPPSIENPFIQFSLNPAESTWSVFSKGSPGSSIEDAFMDLSYKIGRRSFRALHKWHKPVISGPTQQPSQHGTLETITMTIGPEQNGLVFTLTIAVPEKHPLLLWKVNINNTGSKTAKIGKITMLQAGFFPKRRFLPEAGYNTMRFETPPGGYGAVRPHADPGELAFYSNGWQSWSYTGVYGNNDRYRRTRLGPFGAPMWYNRGTPQPRDPGHFASDMYAVHGDRAHRKGILLGFLSQREHFGSIEAATDANYPAVRMWTNGDHAHLLPGKSMETDWGAVQFLDLDDPEPMRPYIDAVSRENAVSLKHKPAAGWCSWYHYFQDVTAEDIASNHQAMVGMQDSLPLSLVQIDDGFERQIGDWFDFSPGFPGGAAPLAAEITNSGLTPGLWLAPYIVHPKSQLRKIHPDWILRNHFRHPVNAGFIWDAFTTALDLTHPDALAYTLDVVRTAVKEWGFPYLKLDFLYAAALPGISKDRTKTRAQVLRAGLEALREAAGEDTYLLGCGCPIGSAVGIVDAMRIGVDAAPDWEPEFKGHKAFFRGETGMPAGRNAVQNPLTRAATHNRWWINDADCLLLRPESNLTLGEIHTAASVIALTGSPLLLSDDLPALPVERLGIARSLLPLIGETPQVLDWFDSPTPRLLRLDLSGAAGNWSLLGVFNWGEQPIQEKLSLEQLNLDPAKSYLVRSFWDQRSWKTDQGAITIPEIPAHGVSLLAIREITPGKPQYLGSSLHISQGLEVTRWQNREETISFELSRPGYTQGEIELYLPGKNYSLFVGDEELPGIRTSIDSSRFQVEFHTHIEITIKKRLTG